MEKRDFYITNKELKNKTRDFMSGSWNKYASITLVLFLILAGLISICTIGVLKLEWYFNIIIIFFSVCLFSLFCYGYNVYCLETMRDSKQSKKLLFAGFSKNALKIFLIFVIKWVCIVVGLALLIFPGIILLIKFSQTSFVLNDDKNLKVIKVLKTSSKLMKSNTTKLMGIWFDCFKWLLLAVMMISVLFIFGINWITFLILEVVVGIVLIWLLPYYTIEKTLFYEDLKTEF